MGSIQLCTGRGGEETLMVSKRRMATDVSDTSDTRGYPESEATP